MGGFGNRDTGNDIPEVGHIPIDFRSCPCLQLVPKSLMSKTFDLSMFQSNFIPIPLWPYVYVESRSEKTLTKLLKISLNLSRGNVTSMFFHINLYLPEEQFTYAAERTPKLRRLVLRAWNQIGQTVVTNAIRIWKDLESLTMRSIEDPSYLFEEIADNCKNFVQLKVIGPTKENFAHALVAYLPKLRVLSLRYAVINKEELIFILDGLRHLEVLNISHALIREYPGPHFSKRIVTKLDHNIIEKASRLKKFLTCMDDSCILCQRAREDEGLLRWYRYEKGLWKTDEASSLAL